MKIKRSQNECLLTITGFMTSMTKRLPHLLCLPDNNTKYRPNSFKSELLDTKILYQFGIFKLSDYKPEDFQKSDNPFAMVLETAWYALKQNKLSDENNFALKLDLARRLHRKGFPKEIFIKMCNFIKYYVSFANTGLLPKLVEEIDTIIETTKPMGIIEAIQEEIKRQATEEGLELGVERNMKDNINKLYRKGFTVEAISEMLEIPLKFVKSAVL